MSPGEAKLNWKELVSAAYHQRAAVESAPAAPRFAEPATVDILNQVSAHLGVSIPNVLVELLAQTNGIMEMLHVGQNQEPVENLWLVWPSYEIVNRNVAIRNGSPALAGPVRTPDFVFFSDAGTDGIMWGMSASGVYAWYPAEDRWERKADALESFLRCWIAGEISV